MDKHTANSLIANSGLHFKTVQLDLNPDEPLVLPGGKTLKYTFLEAVDYLNDSRIRVDVCGTRDNLFVPVSTLNQNDAIELNPNGTVSLDESGVPRIKNTAILSLMENYPSDSPVLSGINSLSSYRIKKGNEVKTAFELILGSWIPMPMFEQEGELSAAYPTGWCRVRIDAVGERQKSGAQRFRFTWGFDTRLAEDPVEGILRPSFLEGSPESKTYAICNRADLLLGNFLTLPNGQNEAPIGDYLVSLLGVDLSGDEDPHKFKFIGWYTYLINYLRLCGAAPVITLYNKQTKQIPVDMSVDVGNSRTCAVLFENGDFTRARMLRLRDLTEPWQSYENAIDMRVVFRRADFGGDLTLDKTLFQWQSLVRIGEEAKHLVYNGVEPNGESERMTNYSSPKRYLWDDRPFDSRWELMVTQDDPTNLKVNPHIFIEGFTDHFDDDGTYLSQAKELDLFSLGDTEKQNRYSRRSLMYFVMVEMLQQALGYINSSKFRDMHGQIDCRRYLRNIIITCPTAMPLKEQYALRESARVAVDLLRQLTPGLPEVKITPSPDILQPSSDLQQLEKRGWLYDEAFASQLVYLYAELTQRYGGKVPQFFQLKGHPRKEIQDLGFEGNSLTIGTIDIGAGTTDIMVTAYGQKGDGRLTPVPLYYDSFYAAGDDILHNIIRDVILEGANNEKEDLGSIGSAVSARIQRMTPDELLQIPRIADTSLYQDAVADIRMALTDEDAKNQRHHLTQELMHHFFAEDSAQMNERDRRCRLSFCTQISHPMSQFFLELLKQGRPTKLYTFDELFPKEKPAAWLLDHFEYHFGFRFEDLSWRYDPEEVAAVVRNTMEPLVKMLSDVMYANHCDILVLSGRPTNLQPLTDLFLKYPSVSPSRLVQLNQYRVGRWFPLATQEGYFQENQKAVVAVGAEVGYLASTAGFNGLVLDFSMMAKVMKPTACYMGIYDEELQEARTPVLTPENSTATLKGISVFPCYIGCKQFNSPKYPARPIYAIYNNSSSPQLNIMLQRNYYEDRETITVEDVTNMEGDSIQLTDIDLHFQTLARDGKFWMDKGAFILKIQEH